MLVDSVLTILVMYDINSLVDSRNASRVLGKQNRRYVT